MVFRHWRRILNAALFFFIIDTDDYYAFEVFIFILLHIRLEKSLAIPEFATLFATTYHIHETQTCLPIDI
jgi:hypothetical protein